MAKRVELYVPQGIGDIFWCYQMFARHYDAIDFKICATEPGVELQRRAENWLKLWPRCGRVEVAKVDGEAYRWLWQYPHRFPGTDDKAVGGRAYSVNRWLETGTRMETIEGEGHAIDWVVKMEGRNPGGEIGDVSAGKFVTLYVSGNGVKTCGCWTPEQWADAAQKLYAKYDLAGMPMVLLGAAYDEWILREIDAILEARKAQPAERAFCINKAPAEVVWMLEKTVFLVGFQSGIGILADNLGTAQLMLYFKQLNSMHYTWCRPEHVKKVYWADRFLRGPARVIDRLEWDGSGI